MFSGSGVGISCLTTTGSVIFTGSGLGTTTGVDFNLTGCLGIKFLSGNYRISDYIIECERGLLANSHVYAESYISKLNELKNKLNNLI